MSPNLLHAPTDEEIDHLASFLDEIPGAMSVTALDGIMTGMLCGPDMLQPTSIFPEIWGNGTPFKDQAQLEQIIGILFRRWNVIVDAMRAPTNKKQDSHYPLCDRTDEACVREWCSGFMRGLERHGPTWRIIFETDENDLIAVVRWVSEGCPDPMLKSKLLPGFMEMESELKATIATILVPYRIYQFYNGLNSTFEKLRKTLALLPKIGRNDPCPCDSGKKYKHCCLNAAPAIH